MTQTMNQQNRTRELDLGGFVVFQPDGNGDDKKCGFVYVENTGTAKLEHWILITQIDEEDDPEGELITWTAPAPGLTETLKVEGDAEAEYDDTDDFLAQVYDPFSGRREYHRHDVTKVE